MIMDIEGLINNQEQEGLQLASNPFALPTTATAAGGGPISASSDSNTAYPPAFSFTTISPTLAANPGFGDAFHTRKRSPLDIDDGAGVTGPHANPPGRKKPQPKSDVGKMSFVKDYPRRRALQACQICRSRKTKCDNERPTCGGCSALGVECSYNEAPASKYHLLTMRLNQTGPRVRNDTRSTCKDRRNPE
jgi:Fungal Zn(2)-Cys(6) binuclear cluster domain